MSKFLVSGKNRICGEIGLQGAKNSVLPVLAAALICDTPATVKACPYIRDVEATFMILKHTGCRIDCEGSAVTIDSSGFTPVEIPDALMREMRSSVILLGAMLAKCGKAQVTFPGGCELGPRPIDLHISAFKRLGVSIEEKHGVLSCKVKNLKGTDIHLGFPSVGATENIMLLASVAKGRTVIENAAKEPEIEDLQNFLNTCGAKISGAGSSTVTIEGVNRLHGCEYEIISDRIVAATYIAAAAVTGGELIINNVNPQHLGAVLAVFEQSGCKVNSEKRRIAVQSGKHISAPATIRSMPYPGFPTDAMAQMMSYLSLCRGSCVFVENIFQNRYKHVAELARMGAKIKVHGSIAVVEGVTALSGASVMSTDLRGGSALVLAALAAEGESEILKVEYIDRGYENFERNLNMLGAKVIRVDAQ